MMGKVTILFVTLFIAVITAAPNHFLNSLKSIEEAKRAATLLDSLQPMHKQQKRISKGEIELAMMMLDADHDGMLNTGELKTLLMMSGAPAGEMDNYLKLMMMFDKDKNYKLDPSELEEVAKVSGF